MLLDKFSEEDIKKLHLQFLAYSPILIALGDEIRQKLILDIAEAGVEGINVKNLSDKSHLSRPAISHHLLLLKKSGLIKPKKVGTQIFYQLNLSEHFDGLQSLLNNVKAFADRLKAEEELIKKAEEEKKEQE